MKKATFLLCVLACVTAQASNYDPKVLPKGHDYFQLRDGLNNCRVAFEQNKSGRIAFLGGSITQGSGWRDMLMEYFKKRFPQTKFDFIPAGIGSLGSVPHAFRLERDVLSRGPVDLLFVEAAVNDHNFDGFPEAEKWALRGMEGVVRHVRTVSPMTDIVEMHFVHDQHLKTWTAGNVPYTVAAHEKVAEQYGCPSLNLSQEVSDRIAAGQFTWSGDFKGLHPSPFGHKVYINSMTRLLDAAFAQPAAPAKKHAIPEQPLDPQSFFRGRFGNIKDAKIIKGFKLVENWTPTIKSGTRAGYVNVPALVASEPGSEFEFAFDGTGAGLMIGAGPDAGIIEVSCDNGPVKKIDTFTHWSKGLYLPWAVIIDDELKPGRHVVRVRLAAEHNRESRGTSLYVFQLLEN